MEGRAGRVRLAREIRVSRRTMADRRGHKPNRIPIELKGGFLLPDFHLLSPHELERLRSHYMNIVGDDDLLLIHFATSTGRHVFYAFSFIAKEVVSKFELKRSCSFHRLVNAARNRFRFMEWSSSCIIIHDLMMVDGNIVLMSSHALSIAIDINVAYHSLFLQELLSDLLTVNRLAHIPSTEGRVGPGRLRAFNLSLQAELTRYNQLRTEMTAINARLVDLGLEPIEDASVEGPAAEGEQQQQEEDGEAEPPLRFRRLSPDRPRPHFADGGFNEERRRLRIVVDREADRLLRRRFQEQEGWEANGNDDEEFFMEAALHQLEEEEMWGRVRGGAEGVQVFEMGAPPNNEQDLHADRHRLAQRNRQAGPFRPRRTPSPIRRHMMRQMQDAARREAELRRHPLMLAERMAERNGNRDQRLMEQLNPTLTESVTLPEQPQQLQARGVEVSRRIASVSALIKKSSVFAALVKELQISGYENMIFEDSVRQVRATQVLLPQHRAAPYTALTFVKKGNDPLEIYESIPGQLVARQFDRIPMNESFNTIQTVLSSPGHVLIFAGVKNCCVIQMYDYNYAEKRMDYRMLSANSKFGLPQHDPGNVLTVTANEPSAVFLATGQFKLWKLDLASNAWTKIQIHHEFSEHQAVMGMSVTNDGRLLGMLRNHQNRNGLAVASVSFQPRRLTAMCIDALRPLMRFDLREACWEEKVVSVTQLLRVLFKLEKEAGELEFLRHLEEMAWMHDRQLVYSGCSLNRIRECRLCHPPDGSEIVPHFH